MRTLILRLRALHSRLHWVSTTLGIAGRIADVFGLAWLVTVLNVLVLLVLLLLVLVDLALRAFLRKFRKLGRILCRYVVDIVDALRQLLRFHLVLTLFLISNSNEQFIGYKPNMNVPALCKRVTVQPVSDDVIRLKMIACG